jgi:hypothetical protein
MQLSAANLLLAGQQALRPQPAAPPRPVQQTEAIKSESFESLVFRQSAPAPQVSTPEAPQSARAAARPGSQVDIRV